MAKTQSFGIVHVALAFGVTYARATVPNTSK